MTNNSAREALEAQRRDKEMEAELLGRFYDRAAEELGEDFVAFDGPMWQPMGEAKLEELLERRRQARAREAMGEAA